MSTHNYNRTLTGSTWSIDVKTLAKEVQTAFPAKSFAARAEGTVVTIAFVDDLSAPEIVSLDAVVAGHEGSSHTVDKAKQHKIGEIDTKTSELIGLGFEFPPASGIMFSLSANGQKTIMAMELAKDDPSFGYPIKYNSKKDDAVASIGDAVTAHDFFLIALGTVRAHLDSGTALKDAVRAAATVAEVEAIVDPR